MDPQNKVQDLTKFMDSISGMLNNLDRIHRWSGYPEIGYAQSVLAHSLLMVIIIGFCLEQEEMLYGNKMNPRLVIRGGTHDFGEGVLGDLMYNFKNHPLLKKFLLKMEHKETMKKLGELYPMDQYLKQIYSNDLFTDKEERFFEAMECLEYMLYAHNEFFHYDHKDFVKVFKRQLPRLEEFSKEFQSIKIFLDLFDPEKIRQAMNNHPEYLDEEVITVTLEDIELMKSVIAELEEKLKNQEKPS